MTSPIQGLYLTCGTIGNVGLPGAPVAYYSLLVYPSANHVSGIVHIKQAIAGPNSDIEIHVTGKIHHTGLGTNTQVVYLTGEYVQCVPPPAFGCYLSKFTAFLATDSGWNGAGDFTYGNNTIAKVPVKNEPCNK